jgi:ficolin
MKFSTKDQDNDMWNRDCATSFKGAWWYKECHDSNLNGMYLGGNHTTFADGIEWRTWTDYYYSLKSTKMMIRRQ